MKNQNISNNCFFKLNIMIFLKFIPTLYTHKYSLCIQTERGTTLTLLMLCTLYAKVVFINKGKFFFRIFNGSHHKFVFFSRNKQDRYMKFGFNWLNIKCVAKRLNFNKL